MGLCKCPKKKVTNLFCFEHRVNVCEHCLVSDHSECIVQSYLQWLQDSDYNPICILCNHKLQDKDCGICVRLPCYDVFHWKCLNNFALRLPSNTAPAGYECPSCKKPLIPKPNHAGPVVESLKQLLQDANWARPGLGLSSLPTEEIDSCAPSHISSPPQMQTSSAQNLLPVQNSFNPLQMVNPALHNHSVSLNMYDTNATFQATGSRKLHENPPVYSNNGAPGRAPVKRTDYDEDKYKRRPALSWLSQWFKSYFPNSKSRDPVNVYKRLAVLVILLFLAFCTLVLLMSHFGREVADSDPMLDPKFNPNIMVRESVQDIAGKMNVGDPNV